MPIVIGDNLKRKRVFIINGQMYEGGAEEYFGGARNNLGGTGSPNGVLPKTEEAEQEQNK